MSEENKEIVRRVFQEMDNGNPVIFYDPFDPDYVGHFPGSLQLLNREDHEQFAKAFYGAFPNLRHIIEDQIAEGDTVVSRITVEGTHMGDFKGMAPTGKEVSYPSMTIHRIVGGKVVEEWVVADILGMMQQLGAIPSTA